MVLTTTVISTKQLPKLPKESRYAMISRLSDEKDAKQAADKIKKEKEVVAEEKRMHKLIVPYLDKLQDQLVEKNLLYFWVYPDQSGFVKHKNLNDDSLQELFLKNIDKYKNRLIASVSIGFYHHDKPTSIMRQEKIYMTTGIEVIHIDKHGIMHGEKKPWACNMAWHADTFKTTKFSFKLIELIYRQTVAKIAVYPSIFGYPLVDIIHELQKKGLDFGDVLKPLPGSII